MLDQHPPETPAAVPCRDEIAGVGNVSRSSHEIRLEVVGPNQRIVLLGQPHASGVRQPVVIELFPTEWRGLRESFKCIDDIGEGRKELVVIAWEKRANLYRHDGWVAPQLLTRRPRRPA